MTGMFRYKTKEDLQQITHLFENKIEIWEQLFKETLRQSDFQFDMNDFSEVVTI